jgi:DNA transposition AAA+ family ATPase
MNKIKKEQIVNALYAYCDRYGSQNKAAKSMKDVSAATISQMLNENWGLIRDEMWRSVAAQIGVKLKDWEQVDTEDHRLITSILEDAKENSLVMAIVGQAGSGKSFTIDHFRNRNKNVFALKCNSFWNKKTMLQEILKEMGIEYRGLTESDMIQDVIHNIIRLENPLLIFDEADKLSDGSLYLFISLYNAIEDECGIVLCATKHLEKSLLRGVSLNKKGYNEIWSRIGRKCIQLKGVTAADIVAVCESNGITDQRSIERVINDSESDLRRVKRKIHAIKKSRTVYIN